MDISTLYLFSGPNGTFNKFQLFLGCQFYWWRKLEYLEKTTNLLQVTDKLYQINLRLIYTLPTKLDFVNTGNTEKHV